MCTLASYWACVKKNLVPSRRSYGYRAIVSVVGWDAQQDYMSHNLNTLKGGFVGYYVGFRMKGLGQV